MTEEVRFQIAQAQAIVTALVDPEDKVYWAAMGAVTNALFFMEEAEPYVARLRELNTELFAEVGVTGKAHLQNEYKVLIQQMVALIMTPETLAEAFDVIEEVYSELDEEDDI